MAGLLRLSVRVSLAALLALSLAACETHTSVQGSGGSAGGGGGLINFGLPF